MITELSPALKQHIEMNIDDIEKGNLTNSIIYCPLDIMEDYIDTLRMIDEVIPEHLIPFTRISCYLASVMLGGRLNDISYGIGGDETYTFEFTYSQLSDVRLLREEVSRRCPHHYVYFDYSLDYINRVMLIKIYISPISK